jgi:hypothetical protein
MPTYQYFYTVQANKNYDPRNYGGGTVSNNQLAELYENPDWLTGETSHKETHPTRTTDLVNGVYTKPATEAAPYATTLKVKKNFTVTYLIRFYLKVTGSAGGSLDGVYYLDSDAISDVTVTESSQTALKKQSSTAITAVGNSTTKSFYPNVIGANNGTAWAYWYLIAKDSFKLNTPFTVTAKVTPQNYTSPNNTVPHPSATVVTIANTDIAGMKPGINCTNAPVVTAVPESFLSALTSRGASTFPTGGDYMNFNYIWAEDTCTKDPKRLIIGVKWFAYKGTSGKLKGKVVVRYARVFSDKDGNVIQNKFLEEEADKTKAYRMCSSLEKIVEEIVTAKLGNCGEEVDPPDTKGDDDKDAIITRPTQPTDALRWNPPPHVDSRGVDYFTRVNKNQFFSASGQAIDPSAFRNIINTYVGSRPERGRIFQDKTTAKAMNLIEGVSLNKKTGNALQWGFRFMYNPEMISYDNSDKSGVDWTYGSKDKGTLLTGSQTINFDLLINRIPDMSYLLNIDKEIANAPNNQSRYDILSVNGAYGRDLQPYEKEGILKRGTEYDIEFLYRVLTGDPKANSLLLEKGSTQLTADIGYTTMVPVWLILHENMRLFGAVSSISVTHRIFNQNMVPMLSRLSIGFQRYPAVDGKPPNTSSTPAST